MCTVGKKTKCNDFFFFRFVHFATAVPAVTRFRLLSSQDCYCQCARGNGKWNMGKFAAPNFNHIFILPQPPISTAFCLPSVQSVRVILCANCFWRLINRECRFNLAHLSHLFEPRAETDWKTRHQWIFTQLVQVLGKVGQQPTIMWTGPLLRLLPYTKHKTEEKMFFSS